MAEFIREIAGAPVRVSPCSFDDRWAVRKAELLAAREMANNPETMKRVVDAYGLEYCKERFPEAFMKPSRIGRLLDRIKFSLAGA